METGKFAEKVFGKTPGLDLVIAAITGVAVPLTLSKETTDRWDFVIAPAFWVSSFLLYRWSGWLDDWVFDPLYGTPKEKTLKLFWRGFRRGFFLVTFLLDHLKILKELATERQGAVAKLRGEPASPDLPSAGIYGSAKKIFSGTSEWEDKVKSLLEYSKAARVFIFPLVIVLFWETLNYFTGWPPYVIQVNTKHQVLRSFIDASQNPLIMYLLLQTPAFLYLYLRMVHLRNLYAMVSNSTVFEFEVAASDGTTRRMLNVGSIVVPKCELTIFKTPTLYVGTIDSATLKVIKDQLPYLEIAVAQDEKALKKRIREAEFDMFIVEPECPIKNVEARLKEIDPTLTDYASTGKTALIVRASLLNDANKKSLLDQYFGS